MDPVAIALELLELKRLPTDVEALNHYVARRIWSNSDRRMEWTDQRRRAWQFLLTRLRADAERRQRINGKAA
jgi:hypothetical protein